MIQNGKDLDFGQSASGLPDVSGGILALFQPVQIGIIQTTQINGYTQTVINEYVPVRGVRVQNSNRLVMSKTGERIWDSVDIYFTREVQLVADDLFLFGDIQYRVLVTDEWTEYGFNHYSVVQDYTKLYEVDEAVIQ